MPRTGKRGTPLVLFAAGAALAVRERRLRAERDSLRTQLEQRRRAGEMRTHWLAGLSHELRTPLATMLSFGQLLAEETSPEARRQDAACLTSCGEHLLALLDDLRDLTALDAGALRLAPESSDPGAIAAECLAALGREAEIRAVRLRFDGLGRPERLLLDPTRLRQVMLNYLANAIDFTHPGGTVTLSVRRAQDRLQVAVSDTGIGLTDAEQRRVFEERFQAAPDRRNLGPERGGSGLGLAIVRQLVLAQGGDVAVTSRPGLGSTFYAWLPWTPAPVEAERALAPRAPGARGDFAALQAGGKTMTVRGATPGRAALSSVHAAP